MDILTNFSLSSVNPVHDTLVDKEIFTTVGGEITFVAEFQHIQDESNFKK